MGGSAVPELVVLGGVGGAVGCVVVAIGVAEVLGCVVALPLGDGVFEAVTLGADSAGDMVDDAPVRGVMAGSFGSDSLHAKLRAAQNAMPTVSSVREENLV